MRFKSLFASMALLLGLASSGRAVDIMITINGTITSANAGMGYAVNDLVSFTWVVNDYAPASPLGIASSNNYYVWRQENAGSEPSLWASVSGTGIGGTYHEAPGNAPFERLWVYQNTSGSDFTVRMDTDSFNTTTNNHGIHLNANSSYLVEELQFSGRINAGFSNITSTIPNPTVYMAGYLGTYAVASQTDGLIVANNGSGSLTANFLATSVTITAVPEPSTYALGTLATGVMAFVARRRRAKRQG